MNRCQICEQGQLLQRKGDYYDYLSEERFEVWQCDHCGSMQTRGGVQGDYYGQAYYGSPEGKFSTILETIFMENHRRNARAFFRRFHPKSVLEIGCGRAYILSELQKLGCEVHGLESAHAADWILNHPSVPIYAAHDGESWPLADDSIDLVIIWHVLEHVSDPGAVLAEIKRVLSPHGTLCISVPNCESLQSRLSLPQWFHLDVPRHLFHFSRTGLILQLENHGYHIKQIHGGDFTQNLFGWWQTLANLLTPKQNNLLYRFLQGGAPWKSCSHKSRLIWQLLGLPLIVPVGIVAWVWESLFAEAGTMTVYANQASADKN